MQFTPSQSAAHLNPGVGFRVHCELHRIAVQDFASAGIRTSHQVRQSHCGLKDSTGQSRFVDEYLVQADSAPRRRASMYFGQMRGKVKSCSTRAEFDDLFCEGS